MVDPFVDELDVADPFVDELGVVDPFVDELFVVEPGKENPPMATVRTNGFAGLTRTIAARAGAASSAHSIIVTRLRRK